MLLNALIDNLCVAERPSDVITQLLHVGFESDDLSELGFSQSDIEDVLEDTALPSIHVCSIQWDTEIDGRVLPQEELNLPSEVVINDEIHKDEIADYLSEMYGYCVHSFSIDLG